MKATTFTKALAIGAGIALTFGALAPSGAAAGSVSSQSVTGSATKALDWLETQFAANGHHLKSGYVDDQGDFQTFDDTGLTIDALLAVAAAGRNADSEAKATSDWVVANADDYITGMTPDALSAGALGKTLLMAKVRAIDPTNVDGHDLEPELRSLLADNGRFRDKGFSDFQTGDPVDYSNAIGQSFDMIGLARTTNGIPASAVNFLLLQQCPNGGFRVQEADAQCTVAADGDVDATSFALHALGAAPSSDAIANAVSDGLDFLASQSTDGVSIEGNANSTGLAAAVFRAIGDAPDANDAATFIKSIQLTSGDNAGAILVDKDTYDAAAADGLDAQGKTLAARATAQGVLALGLPAYTLIGSREPVEPSTTIALSTGSVVAGGAATVSGGGFLSGEVVSVVLNSDPVVLGTAQPDVSGLLSTTVTVPSNTAAGAHTITLLGASSGVTISAPLTVTAAQVATTTTTAPTAPAVIVRTGSATTSQAQVAGLLVAVGAALMLATRRRRIVYPFKR